MGHFILKSKVNLNTAEVGTKISESDFVTTLSDGHFIQMEYVDDNKEKEPYDVHAGIWSIASYGGVLKLEKTEFSKENILESFVSTKQITDKIDAFFNKLDIYKKYGIVVPKRGVLLYGPPGTGKSSSLKLLANTYNALGNTAVILWPTDKIDPHDVKEFIKSFRYNDVNKLILIAEDLGGVEVDEVKVKSYSSLLALLDNQEQAFKVPTVIVATTNHPEVFLGNITNRPGRFSDKIEVGYPDIEARKELVKFFLKERATDDVLEEVSKKKYAEFSPAHIQEIALRSDLYDLSIVESMKQINDEISQFKKMFTKKKEIGLTNDYYD